MTTGKTIALTRWTFVCKVMSLILKMLSRFVIAFLPKNKCLLISWLQSPSAVILETKKIKSVTVSTVFPSICHEMMGLDAMILVFWMLSFKPASLFSSLTFIKRLFSSFLLSAIRVVSPTYQFIDLSPGNLDYCLCFIQSSISHDVLSMVAQLFLFVSVFNTKIKNTNKKQQQNRHSLLHKPQRLCTLALV